MFCDGNLLMCIHSVACLLITLFITNKVKSKFISRPMMIMFSVIFTPYLVFNATMGIYGHARQVVRYPRWNTTKRT